MIVQANILLGLLTLLTFILTGCRSDSAETTPEEIDAYVAAMREVNARQVERNGAIALPTAPGAGQFNITDMHRIASETAASLQLYEDALRGINPPAKLNDDHGRMIDATRSLRITNTQLLSVTADTSPNEILAVLDEAFDALSEFKAACHRIEDETNHPDVLLCAEMLERTGGR